MRRLATICAIIFVVFISACSSENNYHNKKYGFAVTKPKKWHFYETAEDYVFIVKSLDPANNFIPYVQFIAGYRNKNTGDALVVARGIIDGFYKNKDLQLSVIEEPHYVEFAGKKAAYAYYQTNIIIEGKSISLINKVFVLQDDDTYFNLLASTRKDESTGTMEEAEKIFQTIKFD